MSNLKKQNIPFTQVANDVLNKPELSWRAKGLFAYLFGKPEGWDFAGDRIVKDGNDGRKVVYASIKELEQAGLLTRVKKANGRIDYQLKYQADPVAPEGQEPVARLGTLPKRSLTQKVKVSNKDSESNKDSKNNTDGNGQAVAVQVFDIFVKVNPAIKRMYGNTTQRAAIERLVKEFGPVTIVKAANAAVNVLGRPYAPRITTPYQLETDWAKLVAFMNEHKSKANPIVNV